MPSLLKKKVGVKKKKAGVKNVAKYLKSRLQAKKETVNGIRKAHKHIHNLQIGSVY